MAGAWVQSVGFTGTSTTGVATLLGVVTGDAIVVLAGSIPGTTDVINAVTDSQGNTYTRIVTGLNVSSGLTDGDVWLATNVTGGTVIVTVTYNSIVNTTGVVTEVSGLVASPFDQTANASGLNFGSGTMTTGAVTTTSANEYLMGFFWFSSTGGVVLTPTSPYVSEFNYHGGFGDQFYVMDQNVSSTGSYTASGTQGGGTRYLVLLVTLEATGGPVVASAQTVFLIL
jgi:hypothetical protein